MTNKLYTQWADELIQHLLEKDAFPFESYSYDESVKRLATKLESDVKDIVLEWYCNDCDHQRRYNQ